MLSGGWHCTILYHQHYATLAAPFCAIDRYHILSHGVVAYRIEAISHKEVTPLTVWLVIRYTFVMSAPTSIAFTDPQLTSIHHYSQTRTESRYRCTGCDHGIAGTQPSG